MLEASRLIGGLAYGDLVTGTALAVRVIFCGLGVAAALALVRRHRTTLHGVGWWTYFATSGRVRQIYGTN